MYMCYSCARSFEVYELHKETHGFEHPPFEIFACCPYCKSTEFGTDERKKRYAK